MRVSAIPLGIVDITFGREVAPAEAAERAQALGFDHVDLCQRWSGPLALPVADRIARVPRAGFSCPAPVDGPGMWDRTIRMFRRQPGVRLEPWEGSVCNTVDKVRKMLELVPGLRLLLDTGHVAAWGEDPIELLPWTDHIQLRQARPGEPQTLEGDVDFARFFHAARALDYAGVASVEYFDEPTWGTGYGLDDPVAWSIALADEVRPLLTARA